MKKRTFNSNLAEIKISYSSRIKPSDRLIITNSESAASLFREIWSDQIQLLEECNVLFLNRANAVLGWFNVSKGGTSGTIVDPKLVFSTALKCNAQGLILCHNHPSGNLNPSQADLKLTEKLASGGNILDIQILDHIILTKDSYYSFVDEGMI